MNTFLPGNPQKGSQANSADQDQTPHNVVSDQVLHCSLIGFSIQNRLKATTRHGIPKMTNGPVQHKPVEESTSLQWVERLIARDIFKKKICQRFNSHDFSSI